MFIEEGLLIRGVEGLGRKLRREIRGLEKSTKRRSKNYFKIILEKGKTFLPLQSQNEGVKISKTPEAISGNKNLKR